MTQISDVSNDVCMTQDVNTMTSAWTQDDDISNDAGRTSDESSTNVQRKSDVGRVELSHRCGDGGRWRYTVAPRNAAAMAGSNATRSVGHQRTAACSVLPALLQQRAGRRNVAAMADSTLDLAACCCNVLQRAGPRSIVAMSDSTTTPANAALQRFCFCFCFFFTQQLEKKKRMGEREKF